MGARRRWWWLLFACLVPWLPAPCQAGEAPAQPWAVRGAIERILLDRRLQTELPAAASPGAGSQDRPGPGGPREPGRWEPSRGEQASPREPAVPRGVGELARAMLWLAVIVAVAIAAAWLWAAFLDPSRRSWKQARAPRAARRPEPSGEPGGKVLGDADALAADGRYVEAIHVLLLRTIDDLRRRADAPVAESLTSREILAGVEMPDAARAALSDLVSTVELTHFGGRRPARAHYVQCRERYARFAAAYAGDG